MRGKLNIISCFLLVLVCNELNAQYYLSVKNASISIVLDTNQKNHLTLHLNLQNGVPNDTFYIQQSFKENPEYFTTRAKGKFYEGILIDSLIIYNNRGQVTEKGFFRGLYSYNGDTNPDKLDSIAGYGKIGLIGFRHGKFTYYTSGKDYTDYKKETEIEYVDGFLEGKRIHYHPDGSIHTSISYFKDTLHGEYYENYSDGVMKMKENYYKGERDGLCLHWYPNGNLSDSLFFKNGQLEGKVVTYYSDGKKKSIQNYVNYQWHGESWEWYHNGQLKWYSLYDMDKRIGEYQYYDSLGNQKYLWPSSGGVLDGSYISNNSIFDFSIKSTPTQLQMPGNYSKRQIKWFKKSMGMEFECRVSEAKIDTLYIASGTSLLSNRQLKKFMEFIQQNVKTKGIGYNGNYYDGVVRFRVSRPRRNIL